VRIWIVLQVAQASGGAPDAAAFQLVSAFFNAPFLLLAPMNGAIGNSLPKRWVLVASAAMCLAVSLVLAAMQSHWLIGIALIGIGAGLYSPTRYALLPAAAQDTHIPLPRINGWIEMGGAVGIISGMCLGVYLSNSFWQGVPLPLAMTLGAGTLSLLTVLPVWFPSDVRRPEPARKAVIDFFRDCRRILREREARIMLLGLAFFLALIASGAGGVFAVIQGQEPTNPLEALTWALFLVSIGTAAGATLAGIQGHPRRSLGLVPLGASGLLLSLLWALTSSNIIWPSLVLGVMSGLVNVPLRAAYQAAVPRDARGNAMAVMNVAVYGLITLFALLLVGLKAGQVVTTGAGQLALLAVFATAGTLAAWRVFLRDTIEQLTEIILWPVYRIRSHGPGKEQLPLQGPLLLVANHTAYTDPIWLGKVIPRRITPMMTSLFFDLPGLRWLMKEVVHAIRVEASNYRREAPELKQAIAALDRGECVLIFPEGMLRRKSEVTVRQFGQGVWHILSERPDTPVITCWIEGAWGSFFSYCGGPPGKNKRFDWWRSIDVALSEPMNLDLTLLADQRATRTYLMRACLDTRQYLGLEPGMLPEASRPEAALVADEPGDGLDN
jgi:1-acyl-sn-glycerol-3-phosphate acyltransferase